MTRLKGQQNADFAHVGLPGGVSDNPILTDQSIAPLCDEFGRLIVVIDGQVSTTGGSGGGGGGGPFPPKAFAQLDDKLTVDSAVNAFAKRSVTGRGWRLPWQAEFPVERYIADGTTTLTNANFEAALRGAINACVTSIFGGIVTIPSGQWPMSAAELYIDFSTISQPKAFAMKGVGSINTTLNWPGGYNGACLKIGGANSFGIALEDFGINGGGWTSNSSGLVLQQVVGGNFIRIRTTLCGIGIQTLEGNPLGSNSMNCYFEACWTAFCKIGADIIEAYPMYFDTCNFNGMVGAGARSIRLRHSVTVILESCMFQGNNDECHIEQMGGYAQTVLRMQGFCYSEGTTPTFLKVTGPGGRYDFWIEGLYAQSFTTLVDCTPAGNTSTNIFIRIRDLYRDGNTILVKGLNQRNIVIDEADDPINTPSKWVGLDESSRASMVIHKSRNTGRAWSGQKSDDEELTSLLRPFAKDIFDPSIASLITLSGSDVTGMTGLLLGTAAAPASTPQRYVFVKDGDFGGNAYLHGTFAAATNMQGTWAAPYAAGEYGGVFYVARNVIATPGSGEEAVMPNLFVNGASPPAWVGGLGPTAGHVGIGAGVRSPPNPVTRANVGVVGAITYAVYAGHAADSPSVFVVQNICANSVQQPASWPVGNAPQSWPSGIIPSTLYDKFAFSSINPANGVDADLAYVAFLKLPLSRGVATKALQLAMQRFRLGLSALA